MRARDTAGALQCRRSNFENLYSESRAPHANVFVEEMGRNARVLRKPAISPGFDSFFAFFLFPCTKIRVRGNVDRGEFERKIFKLHTEKAFICARRRV